MNDSSQSTPYAIEDIMTVSMARLLRDREHIFFGLASPLPMVAALLAKALHAPDMVIVNVPGGVNPHLNRLPRSTVDPLLTGAADAVFTLADIFDLCARGQLDTIFLRGAQIDRLGNLNNSAIGDDYFKPRVRLPGGAGGAFLLPTAKRAICWIIAHDPRILVEKADFVTAAGNVEWVITPMALLHKGANGLDVSSIHPGFSPEEIREKTGFQVNVDARTPRTQPPTDEEMATLRRIDPEEFRKLEFTVRY